MLLVSRLKVVGPEGQVEFLFPDVVLLRVILQPGQLQLKASAL